MRKVLPAVLLLAVLAMPAASLSAAGATKTVAVKAAAFDPTSVTIKAGDRITWRNTDTKRHQVVSDGGLFASPILGAGKTYSHTFDTAGTFHYHDGLYPSHKAKVVVQAVPKPNTVTLAVSNSVVTYGQGIRLSGTVSSGKANETVTIWQRQIGQVSPVQIGTVLTTAGGVWTFDAQPGILTAYQARFRAASSGEVTVQVRPHVRLLGGSATYFAAKIDPQSFAGHYVVLERKTTAGTWVGVERLKLGKHSGRVFSIPHRRGTTVYRVFLSQKQAGSAYVASWSGTQKVTRR